MCGSLAGWFQVAIQAVDWFVPEHHLSMYWFQVSFLRGVSPRSTDLGDWLGTCIYLFVWYPPLKTHRFYISAIFLVIFGCLRST